MSWNMHRRTGENHKLLTGYLVSRVSFEARIAWIQSRSTSDSTSMSDIFWHWDITMQMYGAHYVCIKIP